MTDITGTAVDITQKHSSRLFWRNVLLGVFLTVLALGFYVTPALTGGPGDQMLSYYIADFVRKGLNWGMASVLSILLLVCVLLLMVTGLLLRQLWDRNKTAGRAA